jgi:hypothetical protein
LGCVQNSPFCSQPLIVLYCRLKLFPFSRTRATTKCHCTRLSVQCDLDYDGRYLSCDRASEGAVRGQSHKQMCPFIVTGPASIPSLRKPPTDPSKGRDRLPPPTEARPPGPLPAEQRRRDGAQGGAAKLAGRAATSACGARFRRGSSLFLDRGGPLGRAGLSGEEWSGDGIQRPPQGQTLTTERAITRCGAFLLRS